MRSKTRVVLLILFAGLVPGLSEAAAPGPLDAFGALVVGEWEADDSRQVFEWGVGQQTIRSRNYFKSEDGWTLVGEGMWFWDGAQETIRGVAVAIEMPVELFEYRSEVQGGEVVHELVAQGAAGGEFVERWVFEGAEYRWTLEVDEDGEPVQIMGGVYRRVGGTPSSPE